MKIIRRLNPHNIIVKFTIGYRGSHKQSSLSFAENYADALRCALNAVTEGYYDVEVIQYREVLHNQRDLRRALVNLKLDSTDAEVNEEVHHATHAPINQNLVKLASSPYYQVASIWGCAA